MGLGVWGLRFEFVIGVEFRGGGFRVEGCGSRGLRFMALRSLGLGVAHHAFRVWVQGFRNSGSTQPPQILIIIAYIHRKYCGVKGDCYR